MTGFFSFSIKWCCSIDFCPPWFLGSHCLSFLSIPPSIFSGCFEDFCFSSILLSRSFIMMFISVIFVAINLVWDLLRFWNYGLRTLIRHTCFHNNGDGSGLSAAGKYRLDMLTGLDHRVICSPRRNKVSDGQNICNRPNIVTQKVYKKI